MSGASGVRLDFASAMRSAATSSGRTAIIIAHRLTTIRDADRIAVIRNGRLMEIGDHDTLTRQGGLYASLYKAYEENAIGVSASPAPDTPMAARPAA